MLYCLIKLEMFGYHVRLTTELTRSLPVRVIINEVSLKVRLTAPGPVAEVPERLPGGVDDLLELTVGLPAHLHLGGELGRVLQHVGGGLTGGVELRALSGHDADV